MPVMGGAAAQSHPFLLIPGVSLPGFTCALEALTLANRFPGGRTACRWSLLSADGGPVAAWNGVTVAVDAGLIELNREGRLIVCAGKNVAAGSTRPVLAWLRAQARKRLSHGALSSGTHTLALAGLMAGRRVTTHCEYRDTLEEALADVTVQDTVYSLDGRVFTCAGGASSMDLMLHLIAEDHDRELMDWVAGQTVYTGPRDASHGQRLRSRSRIFLPRRTWPRSKRRHMACGCASSRKGAGSPMTPAGSWPMPMTASQPGCRAGRARRSRPGMRAWPGVSPGRSSAMWARRITAASSTCAPRSTRRTSPIPGSACGPTPTTPVAIRCRACRCSIASRTRPRAARTCWSTALPAPGGSGPRARAPSTCSAAIARASNMPGRKVSACARRPMIELAPDGELIAVRYLDEAGKRPEMETPDFRHFAPMVQRIVGRHCGR